MNRKYKNLSLYQKVKIKRYLKRIDLISLYRHYGIS